MEFSVLDTVSSVFIKQVYSIQKFVYMKLCMSKVTVVKLCGTALIKALRVSFVHNESYQYR